MKSEIWRERDLERKGKKSEKRNTLIPGWREKEIEREMGNKNK